MRVYFPQAIVRVNALVQLSRTQDQVQTATFTCRPRSVTLERNDYNTPDTCSIELDGAKFPILPRAIRQAHIQVYAGDAGKLDQYENSFDDTFICFIGYIDEPEMSLSEDDAKISWKARDYTGLLLDTKRAPVSLVPAFNDQLDVALRRILDAIPGGTDINLKLVGADAWPQIGLGQPASIKSANAKVPCKPEDSAWHLIKRACDPVALIPRMELDTLVVSTSRGLLAPTNQAVFLYGRNIAEYQEKRQLVRLKEGIGLSGYSLADRKQITAVYPPAGDRQITKHIKKATKKHGTPPTVPGTQDNRKWYPYGTVADEASLEDAAERLFNERSRQEFEGSFKTNEMVVPDNIQTLNEDGTDHDFDVTKLANGDRILVVVEPDHQELLGRFETTEDRVSFLVNEGYDESVAQTLVSVWESGIDGALEVYVRTATHKYDESGYELSVSFQNLMLASAV